MGSEKNVGKYRLGRTIGEGTFSKVKLAVNGNNGEKVAIKVIDKHMVMESNLKNQAKPHLCPPFSFTNLLFTFFNQYKGHPHHIFQVQREIRTMKLLHHPNIVRIHEVIGTKTKIYIVMEYVSGGHLLDKLSYSKKLNECEARKIFQQLIDAVDYCHNRGVYHRDLKPENLLLDSKGNLKVSDFGLSALKKPNDVLNTRCGSPCYVAPELLMSKGYEGAAADVWSCGVILYELLAGFLPFDDQNLMSLYHKICRAEYICPPWFTQSQKKLITKILEPRPAKRITMPDIIEDEWFQADYSPTCGSELDQIINLDDDSVAFDSIEDHKKQRTRLGSTHNILETIEKIEAAATDVRLSVEKMNNFKIKMQPKQIMKRSSRSYFDLSAQEVQFFMFGNCQVIEVSPTHCVVEISKSTGDLRMYNQFCESLSSLLKQKSRMSPQSQDSVDQCDVGIKMQEAECYEEPNNEDSEKVFVGYKSA
ncbi:Serine/threonine-protein kinase, active site [Sesbania bispinosa]|nr:Serine/threonine-protein kinase, active site [Sesbania bispinosa]